MPREPAGDAWSDLRPATAGRRVRRTARSASTSAPGPGPGSGSRIGVLGGTFDPVHIGHLVVAQEARFALALDRVLLVVANDPWQKSGDRPVTPAGERLAVVEAAVAGVPGIQASRIEIDRGGPSYTVETLHEIAAAEPGAALFLVVGADVVPTLPSWHRAADLPSLATLVVARRAGMPRVPDPGGWSAVHLPVPRLDVSSSGLRARLAAGAPVDFLVPAAAIRCIAARGLYAGPR